jgi:hypothetical protein
VVAPPTVAIQVVHWARDGPKFACRIDGGDAFDMAKYNLVQHLQVYHNITMELSKHGRPSIREHDSRVQDHTVMDAQVLNNLFAWFSHNE